MDGWNLVMKYYITLLYVFYDIKLYSWRIHEVVTHWAHEINPLANWWCMLSSLFDVALNVQCRGCWLEAILWKSINIKSQKADMLMINMHSFSAGHAIDAKDIKCIYIWVKVLHVITLMVIISLDFAPPPLPSPHTPKNNNTDLSENYCRVE